MSTMNGTAPSEKTDTRPETVFIGRDNGVSAMIFRPPTAPQGAVVLVEPFGIEALAAEATYRTLTLSLLQRGLAVVRVSPLGTGDSADLQPDESVVGPWIAAVQDAIQLASAVSANVDVVALRLGATIAAYATRSQRVRRLVLWAPVAGKLFSREFKLLGAAGAATSGGNGSPSPTDGPGPAARPGLEAGGFVLSGASLPELNLLDLCKIENVAADGVLLVDRDDLRTVDKVHTHFLSLGLACSKVAPDGYAGMRLDDPEEGTVPHRTVVEIVAWLSEAQSGTDPDTAHPADGGDRHPGGSVHATALRLHTAGTTVVEEPFWVRADGVALYGIMSAVDPASHPASHSATDPATDSATVPTGGVNSGFAAGALPRHAVVLLTTGSNPRCGAGRVQARLARRLAAAGHLVVRFDRRGVGASLPSATDGTLVLDPALDPTVDAYDPAHLGDLDRVLAHVATTWGCTTATLVGMCSGAYTAFHFSRAGHVTHRDQVHRHDADRHVAQRMVRTAVMINQILFMDRLWTTKAESPAMAVKAGYELRNGWRNAAKWKALFSGSISFRKTLARLVLLGRMRSATLASGLLERAGLREPGELGRELRRINASGVQQHYIFDEAETGLGYLDIEGGDELRKLNRSCGLSVRTVAGAGHIFGSSVSKQWLEEQLVALLGPGAVGSGS